MQTTSDGMQDGTSAAQPGSSAGREEHLGVPAAAGLIAGLAFGGAQLASQLLTGTPSLPALLQDRLFAALPGAVTSALIDRLQFWAKPLALTGIVLAQAIGVAVLALILSVCTRRPRPRLTVRREGVLLAALLWLVPELALLPAAGLGILGYRATGGAASALSALVAAVLAAAVYTALRFLWTSPDPLPAQSPSAPSISRRRLVAAGIGFIAAGGAATALLRTIATIGEQSTAPAQAAAPGSSAPSAEAPAAGAFSPPPGISAEITPNSSFYVVSKNFVDPTVSAGGWSLQVRGLVDQPLRLSYSELMALPARDAFVTLECVSNGIGGNLISNTRWTGVPLATLLDRAHAQSTATWAVFGSADGYVESLPIEIARLPTTLLAHHMDGAPLPSKHGFPVRVITAGNYGMKNPKWLTSIEVATQPGNGYWEHEGWNVEAGVRTMARFDTLPHQVTAGQTVPLGGVAFAGDRGIARVEVSTDGGRNWAPAALERPESPDTWVRWSWQWTPEQPGRAMLSVRAVDGKGVPQIAQNHVPYPSGATGYHTIQVQVAAPAN
jgi:DMSO/TMAO reductase YedYZ molybdopterin-dependent catalytic subunit